MKTGNNIQPTTIDEKHTEMLERFKDSECNKIPVIEQEITMLKDNVKKLKNDCVIF
jgi:glycerol-3-phosphate responsive antiterminator